MTIRADTGNLLRSTEIEVTDRRIDAAASHVAASLNRLLDRTGHYPGDPIDEPTHQEISE